MQQKITARVTGIQTILAMVLSLVLATGMVACDNKSGSVTLATDVIRVTGAYIRAMPPGQKVTAMFVTLENTSTDVHDLVKVESHVSDAVELHEHKHVDGVMRMGQVKRISIPENGSIALAPGGYHVMMIGLKKDLKLGDKVAMKLIFEDGSSQDIQPEVKAINTE